MDDDSIRDKFNLLPVLSDVIRDAERGSDPSIPRESMGQLLKRINECREYVKGLPGDTRTEAEQTRLYQQLQREKAEKQ